MPETVQNLLERHQYALVDRLSVGEDACKGLPIEPLIPHALRSDAPAMPGLLALDPNAPWWPSSLIENIEEASREGAETQHLLCALLAVQPDTEPDDLHEHLSDRLVLRSPRDRYFLRYFDPRVFPHLAYRILGVKRVQSLFGPVCEWTFRFQNEWWTVPMPQDEGVVPLAWQVDAAERDALDDVVLLNKALAQCDSPWKTFREWRAAMNTGVVSLQVARSLFRLAQEGDLVSFICHSIIHGEFFYRHEVIQSLLKEAVKPGQSYAGSAALLTEEEWAAIESKTGHSAQSI